METVDKGKQNSPFVLMSFMTPENISGSDYSHLYDKIQKEVDTAKKCEMYEILLNLKNNTRALKILGCFDTYEQACENAVVLRDRDPSFDIFAGPVGEWLPWDDKNRVEEENFANEKLDKLMSEYKEQAKLSKKEHEERLRSSVQT